MTLTSPSLKMLLQGSPYQAYTYAYPHKTAYRGLEPPIPLRELWADEDRSSLFLYLHIPFCEMRCGFCNLFTTVNAPESLERAYLSALERQARVVREALGDASFSRMAIGGGTPTYLEAPDLHRLFDLAELYGLDLQSTPISVETSPATATPERLEALRSRHVDRISLGVQSFIEPEVRAVGRPQRGAEVFGALENIQAAGFPTLNIDLIYGMAGQTPQTWLQSLGQALEFEPQEIFMYPLYVRPLTGLGKQGKDWEEAALRSATPSAEREEAAQGSATPSAERDDHRLELYRIGRDFLLAQGYTQLSMRVFKRTNDLEEGLGTLHYDSQRDGMVGLGCGARSYTQGLHHASEYAVGQVGVRAILEDYVRQPEASFALAHYGFRLSLEEQQRRFVLYSLLNVQGTNLKAYWEHFGSSVFEDLPELGELLKLGLAIVQDGFLRLNERGLEYSDTIGCWLYSAQVRALMQDYEPR